MPRSDSPLRDRVVFLVGARRSGTNWLERILTAHPDVVAMPSETHLISHGIRPLSERFQHSNPGATEPGRTFMPRDAFLDASRDFLDQVLADSLQRLQPDARLLVERTPWHVTHLDLVHRLYPDSHVVGIVRDGRAVARSLMSMPWGAASVEEAAEEWRAAIDGLRVGERLFGDRYREVSYEGLLSDLRGNVGALLAWLGLDLTEAIWAAISAEARAEFNVDRSAPGIATDKWRASLSAEDLRTFERVAGRHLEKKGYPRAAPVAREVRRPRVGLARAAEAVHPRRTAQAALARHRVKHDQRTTFEHRMLVGDFERHVAAGDEAAARALLSQRLWTRVDDAGSVAEGRGAEAAVSLLRALSAHRGDGFQPLTGSVEIATRSVTTTTTYRLHDSSTWVQMAVYAGNGRSIDRVAVYRHELRPRGPADRG